MRRLFTLAVILSLVGVPAFAQETKSAFTEAQRKELETIIKDYVMANPQVLITSVDQYYKKQAPQQADNNRMDVVPAGLHDYPMTPYVGKKDAKLVVVEFFDYNCGYCKQVAVDVARLADDIKKENLDVKIMFKELPILSESSELAARYALAAHKQGKYLEYHMALMNHQGTKTLDILEAKAKELGLDVAKMKKDAESVDVRDALEKNISLAKELGARGTPFFTIGKEKIPGAISYDRMRDTLAKEGGPAVSAAPAPAAAATATTAAAPTQAAAPAPAAAAPAMDAGVQAEINKAREEARAAIDEIKKQAEALQRQAQEDMKRAQAEAEKKEAPKKQ